MLKTSATNIYLSCIWGKKNVAVNTDQRPKLIISSLVNFLFEDSKKNVASIKINNVNSCTENNLYLNIKTGWNK